MNNFFDDLDKSIKNSKDVKLEQEKIYNEIIKKHYALKDKIFKKELIDDFRNLETIYKKNKDKDENIEINFFVNICTLKITKKLSYPEGSSKQIVLSFEGRRPDMFDDLKVLEKFKISEDNLYLRVEDLGDYEWDESPFGGSRQIISIKKFTIKEKKFCYEYFNNLFKKKILVLR